MVGSPGLSPVLLCRLGMAPPSFLEISLPSHNLELWGGANTSRRSYDWNLENGVMEREAGLGRYILFAKHPLDMMGLARGHGSIKLFRWSAITHLEIM